MKRELVLSGMTQITRVGLLLSIALLPILMWAQGRPDILWTRENAEFRSASFSPDGQTLALRSGFGIHLYQLPDYSLKRTLTVSLFDTAYRIPPVFSPDGQYVAAAGYWSDGWVVRVWRTSGGQPVHSFPYPGSPDTSLSVRAIAFTPDGRHLLVYVVQRSGSGSTGNIDTWRLSDGVRVRSLSSLPYSELAAFSSDSQYLGVAGYGGASVRRVSDGTLVRSWDFESRFTALCITLSPDGREMAVGGYITPSSYSQPQRGIIYVFRIPTGGVLQFDHTSDHPYAGVTSVAYSPSGVLASAGYYASSYDNPTITVRIWDTGRTLNLGSASGSTVAFVSFAHDGQSLVTCSRYGAQIWRLSDLTLVHTIEREGFNNRVAFSRNGELIVSSSSNESVVRLWDVESGALRFVLEHEGVQDAVLSPNGQYLASASSSPGFIKLWRTADGALIRTIFPGGYRIAFSPNNLYIAAASGSLVRLWRIDGLLVRAMDISPLVETSIAFSPDGQLLLVAGRSSSSPAQYQAQIWRLMDGTRIRTIPLDAHPLCVAFSPDGQYMAIGDDVSRFGRVHVWRVSDGALFRTFSAHLGGVRGIAFSADGRYLISGSADATISISQLADGALMQIYDQDTASGIASLAAAATHDRLFAYTRDDGTLVVARYRIWGDVDGDGCVSDSDLAQILFAFGQTVEDAPEDISRDGVVDDLDLILVLVYFGSGC